MEPGQEPRLLPHSTASQERALTANPQNHPKLEAEILSNRTSYRQKTQAPVQALSSPLLPSQARHEVDAQCLLFPQH